MNDLFKCSNDSFTFFKVAPKKKKVSYVKRQLNAYFWFLLPHGFYFACSILNGKKLFRNHSVLMFKNTYVNRQKKSRYQLEIHAKSPERNGQVLLLK